MRTAGAGEDRVTRLDRKFLAVHLHHAFTAEDVIDLVLFLQVVADGLAGAQRAFSEDLFEAGGLLEETVAGHSPLYTERLQQASVRISTDGKGRALDNILTGRLWRTLKYEEVYLNDYANPEEARRGIGGYFDFYNNRRPHQSFAAAILRRAGALAVDELWIGLAFGHRQNLLNLDFVPPTIAEVVFVQKPRAFSAGCAVEPRPELIPAVVPPFI